MSGLDNIGDSIVSLDKIRANEKFNIAGVLIEYNKEYEKNGFIFKLTNSYGNIVKISYYIEYGCLYPTDLYNYCLIIIKNIKFKVVKGSLIGVLTKDTIYEVFNKDQLNTYPKYKEMVEIVEEIYEFSSLSFEIPEPAAKKLKYTNTNEIIPSTSTFNQFQPIRETTLPPFSSAVLNKLSDIQPGETYQIFAQVVKHKISYGTLSEFIITDYSSNNKLYDLNKEGVELPNSKTLRGNYFLKLALWDEQKEVLLNAPRFSFFHFTKVVAKKDKFGNIELNIHGKRAGYSNNTNITTLLPMDHKKCIEIKERMNEVLGGN